LRQMEKRTNRRKRDVGQDPLLLGGGESFEESSHRKTWKLAKESLDLGGKVSQHLNRNAS